MENEAVVSKNFIENIIEKDLSEGHCESICTRFPPEPNGYLHIGHAKAILINYGLAQKYGGKFNMRFDDTNPTKEKIEFVESIKADVAWLGADWEDRLYFASEYFDKMYEGAIELIKKGKAYVSDLTAEQISQGYYHHDEHGPCKITFVYLPASSAGPYNCQNYADYRNCHEQRDAYVTFCCYRLIFAVRTGRIVRLHIYSLRLWLLCRCRL